MFWVSAPIDPYWSLWCVLVAGPLDAECVLPASGEQGDRRRGTESDCLPWRLQPVVQPAVSQVTSQKQLTLCFLLQSRITVWISVSCSAKHKQLFCKANGSRGLSQTTPNTLSLSPLFAFVFHTDGRDFARCSSACFSSQSEVECF